MTAARLSVATAVAALAAAQSMSALAANADCRPSDLAKLSTWGGVWITEGLETGVSGRSDAGPQQELAGFSAPWTAEGWSRFEGVARLAVQARVKQAGWGFPVMMDSPAPFNSSSRRARRRSPANIARSATSTPMAGASAAGDVWPTVWGDSIGCWKGQTLEIDTVAVKYSPDFNFFAPPLSDQARYVERIRLVAPGRLESDITITDPVMLEKPWTLKMTYVRPKGIDRLIHDGDIFDNDRSATGEGSGAIAPPREKVSLPAPSAEPDAKLTAAELDRVAGDYAYDGAPLRLKVERREQRLFFEVLPALPFWLPLHPKSALDFEFGGIPFHFTADATGQISGFATTNPDGTSASGKRVKDAGR